MSLELEIPLQVPVMTLPSITFFPQAILPLHIFEPRYRLMLQETLDRDRLFAVATLDPKGEIEESPHSVATVGIIRACHKNENGTSDLLLQGLARVRVEAIVREAPYRLIQIQALASHAGATAETNGALRDQLASLLRTKHRLGGDVSKELLQFLRTVPELDTFVDLAAFAACSDPQVRLALLSTLDTHQRLQLLLRHVTQEVAALQLQRKLQGPLSDDSISAN